MLNNLTVTGIPYRSGAVRLIIGLAPGMHGANRTGRPFTGDFAGVLLYQTLYKYGFSNQAPSLIPFSQINLALILGNIIADNSSKIIKANRR